MDLIDSRPFRIMVLSLAVLLLATAPVSASTLSFSYLLRPNKVKQPKNVALHDEGQRISQTNDDSEFTAA